MSSPGCVVCVKCFQSCLFREILSSEFPENEATGRKLLRYFTRTQLEESLLDAKRFGVGLKEALLSLIRESERRLMNPTEGATAELKVLSEMVDSKYVEISAVQAEVNVAEKQVSDLQQEIDHFTKLIPVAEAKLADTEGKLNEFRSRLIRRGGAGGGEHGSDALVEILEIENVADQDLNHDVLDLINKLYLNQGPLYNEPLNLDYGNLEPGSGNGGGDGEIVSGSGSGNGGGDREIVSGSGNGGLDSGAKPNEENVVVVAANVMQNTSSSSEENDAKDDPVEDPDWEGGAKYQADVQPMDNRPKRERKDPKAKFGDYYYL